MDPVDNSSRALFRRPRPEGDAENQLPLVQPAPSILPIQSEAYSSAKSAQTQYSERLQDDSASKNEFASRDPKTRVLPKRRRRRVAVGNAAGASALGASAEVEGMGIEEIWSMPPQGKMSRSERSHVQRKEYLLKVLDPLMSEGSSTLLLCRGSENHCRITPVHIHDSADSTTQWRQAHRVWNEQNESWRSWLPRYGVQSVTVVTVSPCPRFLFHW